jgi:hypothetical protein
VEEYPKARSCAVAGGGWRRILVLDWYYLLELEATGIGHPPSIPLPYSLRRRASLISLWILGEIICVDKGESVVRAFTLTSRSYSSSRGRRVAQFQNNKQ